MSFEAFLVIILAINLACAVVAALIAARSGLDPFSWVLVCSVLGPFGLLALFAIRGQRDDIEPIKTSSSGAPTSSRRILVPVDGSDASLTAVDYAAGVVHRSGGSVTLLAVLPLDRSDGPTASPGSARRTEFDNDCAEHFGKAVARLQATDTPHETEISFGDPADEIVRIASAKPYDLLIIARRGRGLTNMLLGSVSEKVLQNATVPVTVAG